MPYGQNKRVNFNSIVINALRAKEKIKFKQFLSEIARTFIAYDVLIKMFFCCLLFL